MSKPTTTWGIGDYPSMARQLEPVAQAAVDAAAMAPGERVIDLATGTGNAALLAAGRGGHVVGVDAELALLQLAEQRSREAGLDVRWLSGDLHALPVADDAADVVLSIFGLMYATDQAVAADELARVAAPGARIVLAAWVPGSLLPAMGQVLSGYLPPPPPGSGSPSLWGDPDALQMLLKDSGLAVTAAVPGRLVLAFPDPRVAADFLIRTAGHVLSEQRRLTDDGQWGDLRRDLIAFIQHRAEPTGDQVHLTLEYLLATARQEPYGSFGIDR